MKRSAVKLLCVDMEGTIDRRALMEADSGHYRAMVGAIADKIIETNTFKQLALRVDGAMVDARRAYQAGACYYGLSMGRMKRESATK